MNTDKFEVVIPFMIYKAGDLIEASFDDCYHLYSDDLEGGYWSKELHEMYGLVNLGILKKIEPEKTKDEKLIAFIDQKIKEYTENRRNVIKAYKKGAVPQCVRVESDTVHFNMIKLLKEIRTMINE